MAEKQKILIVDDDLNIAELIALYLTKECFETRIVGDGEEAVKQFDEFKPNLVLLDLMLPGIDGYEVCRHPQDGGHADHHALGEGRDLRQGARPRARCR